MSKPELGRALAYLLHILGEDGRADLRQWMLDAAGEGNADARNLLNAMNDFERARDALDRDPESANPAP